MLSVKNNVLSTYVGQTIQEGKSITSSVCGINQANENNKSHKKEGRIAKRKRGREEYRENADASLLRCLIEIAFFKRASSKCTPLSRNKR